MSEEILKALAQLYAIITKQDFGVTEKERANVINALRKKLDRDTVTEYINLYDEHVGYGKEITEESSEKKKLTSVKDSVKTLAICKKINRTLTQKQKVIVLVELLELVLSDKNYTQQRRKIIDTVADVFNIEVSEYKLIEDFVLSDSVDSYDSENILVVDDNEKSTSPSLTKHIHAELLEGSLAFLRLKSVDLYFVKYMGPDDININGISLPSEDVNLFSHGSTIKSSKGASFFYSDIVGNYLTELNNVKLSFNANNVGYTFFNGTVGLTEINISEGAGKLIGIMGASGAGKTTLLNVLSGLNKPSEGDVFINGIDIYKDKDKEKIRGLIGYISQDDLLIEELTVFENLYYNAKLCFKGLSKEEINLKVDKVLDNLGLLHIKNLKVGSPLNKTISGGQRKRLNIALELIREPAVLFVDEPTSGLSSRDSENVIDLLKELSLRGKLIFVVIHQPSSDVYKMFDKFIILDIGGYQIFYGNPVEAITFFKKQAGQADSDKGQCSSCGNVNPEQIFNTVEERVVDEYGNFTPKRKISPLQWRQYFKSNYIIKKVQDIKDYTAIELNIPGKISQLLIFTTRDFKSKISNSQYVLINLLEAPLLATILAFIVRYSNDTTGTNYLYRYNDNIPAYLLMCIVVALFMGLSVSAEEIIKDKKNLKRESFLNLSRLSYLSSKLIILFSLSAIQTLSFVLIGNWILHIEGMLFPYWIVLFSVACGANVVGLNISSAFNSAITVYILIPILLIPQMILSGAMFSFDKINDVIRSEDKVPLVADLIASRWAFEAMAVHQFKYNNYENKLYETEQVESITNYHIVYLFSEMDERINYVNLHIKSNADSLKKKAVHNLFVVRNEFEKQRKVMETSNIDFSFVDLLTEKDFNDDVSRRAHGTIDLLREIYNESFLSYSNKKEMLLAGIDNRKFEGLNLVQLKDKYYNESLSDLVRNVSAKRRIIEVNGSLVPKVDYVFFLPFNQGNKYDYRTHFFAPVKNFFGLYLQTIVFNVLVIWFLTVFLFVMLYFDLLRKFINLFERLSLKKKQL